MRTSAFAPNRSRLALPGDLGRAFPIRALRRIFVRNRRRIPAWMGNVERYSDDSSSGLKFTILNSASKGTP